MLHRKRTSQIENIEIAFTKYKFFCLNYQPKGLTGGNTCIISKIIDLEDKIVSSFMETKFQKVLFFLFSGLWLHANIIYFKHIYLCKFLQSWRKLASHTKL